MIHIFFVPGMFGSMLEAVLRAFTDLGGTVDPAIKPDGSMHTFQKQHHPLHTNDIAALASSTLVTTPIYPFASAKLPEILREYEKLPGWQQDYKILVYAADRKWAEINMLFQYHKIAVGLRRGLDIFGGNTDHDACRRWNPDYQTFSDMRVWERREWLSLFYPGWITDWMQSPRHVGPEFLVLTNQQLLESTQECLLQVAKFCGLSITSAANQFIEQYQSQQQYVLDEYIQIQSMLYHVLHDVPATWTRSLSIIGEAILQQNFRALGWEWRCDGLDTLPMNSVELRNIIYQPHKDLHA